MHCCFHLARLQEHFSSFNYVMCQRAIATTPKLATILRLIASWKRNYEITLRERNWKIRCSLNCPDIYELFNLFCPRLTEVVQGVSIMPWLLFISTSDINDGIWISIALFIEAMYYVFCFLRHSAAPTAATIPSLFWARVRENSHRDAGALAATRTTTAGGIPTPKPFPQKASCPLY